MDTVYDTGTLSILMLSGEIQAKTITYTLRFRLHVILKTGPPSDKRQASGCLGLESVCFECGWKKCLDMKDLFYMIDCSDRYGTA